MSHEILIVDYGSGNLSSIRNSLRRLGCPSKTSSDPAEIRNAKKIILPGVGHFGAAMKELRRLDLLDALNEAVLVRKTPILGICLGMELMAKTSEEGGTEGLGWLDAEMVKFRASDRRRYKVPHIGWNKVHVRKQSRLMSGIPEASEFYFVHSYHLKLADRSDMLNETVYEFPYPSAIEKGNIFGVQYHPEKSRDAGQLLLKNFVEL